MNTKSFDLGEALEKNDITERIKIIGMQKFQD